MGRWRARCSDAQWAFWGTVLAAIILALATYLSRPSTSEPPVPVSLPAGNAPAIREPNGGDGVGPTVPIRGVSPLTQYDHYVLVTASKTGTRYVVGGPFRPSADGIFHSGARFGAGELGVGEEFSIEVVATAARLYEGELSKLPDDANTSLAVTVTRTH